MDLELSPNFVPASPDLFPPDAPPPRAKRLQPTPDAYRVYAVFNKAGSLMGVLTSPVDAAQTVKDFGPGAFTQTCVLNAI